MDTQDVKDKLSSVYRNLINDVSFFGDLLNDLYDVNSDLWDSELETIRKQVQKLEKIRDKAIQLLYDAHDIEMRRGRVEVAVVGNFSSGKSYFINSLLGLPICPTDTAATTSSITRFEYGDEEHILQCRGNGDEEITRQQYTTLVKHGPTHTTHKESTFRYFYPFESLRQITLVDTPGFNNPDCPSDEEVTEKELENADVLFFLIDVNKGGISADVKRRIENLKSAKNDLDVYLVLNKSDTKTRDALKRIEESVRNDYADLFCDIFPYSSTQELAAHGCGPEKNATELINWICRHIDAGCDSATLQILRSQSGVSICFGEQSYQFERYQNIPPTTKREDVIKILRRIGKKRDELGLKRFFYNLERYNRNKQRCLSKLSNALNAAIDNNNAESDIEPVLLEAWDKFTLIVHEKTMEMCAAMAQEIASYKDEGILSYKWKISVDNFDQAFAIWDDDDVWSDFLEELQAHFTGLLSGEDLKFVCEQGQDAIRACQKEFKDNLQRESNDINEILRDTTFNSEAQILTIQNLIYFIFHAWCFQTIYNNLSEMRELLNRIALLESYESEHEREKFFERLLDMHNKIGYNIKNKRAYLCANMRYFQILKFNKIIYWISMSG